MGLLNRPRVVFLSDRFEKTARRKAQLEKLGLQVFAFDDFDSFLAEGPPGPDLFIVGVNFGHPCGQAIARTRESYPNTPILAYAAISGVELFAKEKGATFFVAYNDRLMGRGNFVKVLSRAELWLNDYKTAYMKKAAIVPQDPKGSVCSQAFLHNTSSGD